MKSGDRAADHYDLLGQVVMSPTDGHCPVLLFEKCLYCYLDWVGQTHCHIPRQVEHCRDEVTSLCGHRIDSLGCSVI